MTGAPHRFKVDENLPLEIVDLLAEAGHDATSVHSQDLVGRPDPDVADVCRIEGRAIVTLDVDFADIQTYPPARYAGLMVLRLARQDKPHVIDVFRRALTRLGDEDIRGHLWIVEEHRVRIRGGDADD
jgi:predicted nuclease of predicted toxin-antitoxin system